MAGSAKSDQLFAIWHCQKPMKTREQMPRSAISTSTDTPTGEAAQEPILLRTWCFDISLIEAQIVGAYADGNTLLFCAKAFLTTRRDVRSIIRRHNPDLLRNGDRGKLRRRTRRGR